MTQLRGTTTNQAPTPGIEALAKPIPLAVSDLLLLGVLGVRTRPLRAALSALGIAIGIAAMITVVGIPASSQRALMTQLSALGTNLLRAEAVPDPITRQPAEVPEESVAMAARIEPVQKASAVANTHAEVRRSERISSSETSGLTVLACKPNLLDVLDARVHSGVPLNQVTERFPTAVLGDKAATRLGITDLRPGEPAPQIWINDRWFTVIGVLDAMPLAPDVERSVLVGWQAARSQLGFNGHPTVIYVRTSEPALEDVRAVLPATLHPAEPGAVQVSRPSDALTAKRATQDTFSALFLGLAAVALLVGGVGAANTMVISVLERKREIGLRRALGANRYQIRAQFLTESVVLCGLGGLGGALLALLATTGYAMWRGWPVVVSPAATLGGVGAAIGVGVLAGVYPAIRASRLTPTEALSAP